MQIADTLLHLPETFPASYLKIYDPSLRNAFDCRERCHMLTLRTCCLGVPGRVWFPDHCPVYCGSFLRWRICRASSTPAFRLAHLTRIVGWVRSCSHLSPTKKAPLERTAGLFLVVGFPESDYKITDPQVNVPPAAMVAFLASRAYRLDCHSGPLPAGEKNPFGQTNDVHEQVARPGAALQKFNWQSQLYR